MSIASNKISRSNIEKLLSPTVIIEDYDGTYKEVDNTESSNDIQLYIELSKRQDGLGRVEGVYYSEFMELLDCSKATFYNSLYRLERLGYIIAEPSRKGYWTITLTNNIFLTKEDYKKGYIRTNVDFLYSEDFKKMSCVEKKICLYLHLNKDHYSKLEVYPENLAKAIGIKIVSVIKDALFAISKIFPNTIVKGSQGNKIIFGQTTVRKNEETEDSNYIKHKLTHMCRIYGIKHTVQDIKDVAILSGQYIKRIGYNSFIKIVNHTIYHSTLDKSLKPSYINRLCSLQSKISK